MADANRLTVSVLGTSFTIRADEDEAYLKRVLWCLERKIDEVKNRVSITDPLKISILTSLSVIDELLREKNRGKGNSVLHEESDEMERIALRLISEIDDVIT